MVFFLKIFLAHILGDFVLQPSNWVIDKAKKKVGSTKLYYHILVHFILVSSILQFNFKEYGLAIIGIPILHYCIDVLKLYQQKKKERIWFFLDQILHLIVLILAVVYYKEVQFSFDAIFTDSNLLFVIFLVLITSVSSVIIKTVISKWNPEKDKKTDNSLAKAGTFIGVLERLFVFAFIITNHWEAIGFLLAAKSVFRFGDLTSSKDRKLTEYILIGTLLSFGFAIFLGIIYQYILQFIN